MYSANMDLLITHLRTQTVADLMEFDSFHWIVPHTAVRHSEQHKQAKTNCPLCLVTGSNISYRLFLFFLLKYSKLFLSLLLSDFLSPLLFFFIYHFFFHHFSFFSVSSFLSFVYSSSILPFFTGSLVPGQQLSTPIVSGNKPWKSR